jgi:AcrR family transcriptional regulator
VDAIVEATARVLVSRGYENLNVAEVADIAGVSIGSLYQYFPHKEALVVGLLERHADREAAFLEARFAAVQAPSAAAMLHAAVAAVLAFRATEPALHQALTNIIPIVGRYDDLRDRGARTALLLRALLEPVYRPEDGRPSLDELVFMVANATHALTHEGLLPRPASLSDERLSSEITRLWVGYLELPPAEP